MLTPSLALYRFWRSQARTLEGLEAYTTSDVALTGGEEPEQLTAALERAAMSVGVPPRIGVMFGSIWIDDRPAPESARPGAIAGTYVDGE